MTFTNVLESQIKLLICLESKAGSGTPLAVFNNACRQEETEVTKLSQNNLSIFTVIYVYAACAVRLTILVLVVRKFQPVSNFTELHTLTLAAHSYVLLVVVIGVLFCAHKIHAHKSA